MTDADLMAQDSIYTVTMYTPQKVDDALCSSCLCMWCVSHMNPWFVNAIYTFTDELFSARRLFKVVFSGLFLERRF